MKYTDDGLQPVCHVLSVDWSAYSWMVGLESLPVLPKVIKFLDQVTGLLPERFDFVCDSAEVVQSSYRGHTSAGDCYNIACIRQMLHLARIELGRGA